MKRIWMAGAMALPRRAACSAGDLLLYGSKHALRPPAIYETGGRRLQLERLLHRRERRLRFRQERLGRSCTISPASAPLAAFSAHSASSSVRPSAPISRLTPSCSASRATTTRRGSTARSERALRLAGLRRRRAVRNQEHLARHHPRAVSATRPTACCPTAPPAAHSASHLGRRHSGLQRSLWKPAGPRALASRRPSSTTGRHASSICTSISPTAPATASIPWRRHRGSTWRARTVKFNTSLIRLGVDYKFQ